MLLIQFFSIKEQVWTTLEGQYGFYLLRMELYIHWDRPSSPFHHRQVLKLPAHTLLKWIVLTYILSLLICKAMLQGGGWGKRGCELFPAPSTQFEVKNFPFYSRGLFFFDLFTVSWQVLNALFSKWCPSGRLRDRPAFAGLCCSPASCAHPGYSTLPNGAWRPKEWVPKCSSPPSGGEDPTLELLPRCPGPSRGKSA